MKESDQLSAISYSGVSEPKAVAGEGCGATSISAGRHGFCEKLEYHLLLAHDLHCLETAKYQGLDEQVTEVKRMLASFIQKLKAEC